jgi:late competence protein required for DNA uptake (superfamily II DNA/RNA helicase)
MQSKLSAPLLKGKIAECSRCKNAFILNKRALRMESPCCEDCVVRKNVNKEKEAEQFFETLEKELLK